MRAPKTMRRPTVELLICDLGRRLSAQAQAQAAGDGVAISEGAWWVLYELAHATHGLSLVDVAHQTALSASTVTTVTDQLAARGWIERARATVDRRRVVAVITETGADVLDDAMTRCDAAFAAHRDRLTTAEWQHLQHLLTRLASHRTDLPACEPPLPHSDDR
ncbi:MarR family winged helix-turn-helix transcriptional regulator [Actinoplanes xinjiangensis]|uniref:MarR family winged helix-turn-helix transcriptional regulator n=1 Tax=Actinoplanes xinjiangensis TaxID=512350 RepID=UPI003436B0A0